MLTGRFSPNFQGNFGLRLADQRRPKQFGAFVVMGGYHPTLMPDEMLASDCVDAVVRGEGELTFRELILQGPSRDVSGTVGCEPWISTTGRRLCLSGP